MRELIYYKKNLLKPIGGPTGYLFNLNKELERCNNSEITFINSKDSFIKKCALRLPKKIAKKIQYLKRYITRLSDLKKFYKGEKKSIVNLNDYDIIHFHSTMDMYMAKDSLKEYKGITVLTSHSPKVHFKELIEDYTLKKDYKKYKEKFDGYEEADIYSFLNADYIMFPVPQSEECYYNTWDKYNEIRKKSRAKHIYIPTGITPINTQKFNREIIREKYNIPQEAFVVCYVGRHNEIKGYDQLKIIAQEILKERKNIYFLIAGQEKPIKGIKDNHWIEVGWTNQAHEIIYSSDVFILPNKETYFDLILLEVRSIGKPVVLTNTGGNKYFKKFNNSGLFYYDYGDNDMAKQLILNLKNDNNMEKYGSLNKEIFNKNFTIEKFTIEYIKEMKKIYIEGENEKINKKELHL